MQEEKVKQFNNALVNVKLALSELSEIWGNNPEIEVDNYPKNLMGSFDEVAMEFQNVKIKSPEWVIEFQKAHLKQMNEKPTLENIEDMGLDDRSMQLLANLDNAYLILYNEGQGLGGFLNIVFKDGRAMETIEIG
jgi:hypothetical protein